MQTVAGKLAKRFYGPFQVLTCVGPAAYRLQLPEGTRIHPVFHCSLLKPFKGIPEQADTASFPDQFINDHPVHPPLAILDYRRSSLEPRALWDVLVQWRGLSPDEATWEDWNQLKQDHHLEDKVILQGPQEDDSKPKIGNAETEQEGQIEKRGVQGEKTKRRICRPTYLKNYI